MRLAKLFTSNSYRVRIYMPGSWLSQFQIEIFPKKLQ